MRKVFLYGAIVSVLALMPLSTSAVNVQVLPNAGFEMGTASPWSNNGSGGGITSVVHRKGNWAWELSVGQSPNSVTQSNIALVSTSIYHHSAWVYVTDVPDPLSGVKVTLSSCFWRDPEGNDKVTRSTDLYIKQSNTWTEIEDPVGYKGFYNMEYFTVSVFSGNSKAYVDDCDLITAATHSPEPASIIGLGLSASSIIGFAMRRRRS